LLRARAETALLRARANEGERVRVRLTPRCVRNVARLSAQPWRRGETGTRLLEAAITPRVTSRASPSIRCA